MVSVAVDIGHRQVSSSGRVGSAGPAPSSTTVLAWPRYSVHPHPRPRNRIRLPGIAWLLLASAFALPGAPPALAQAPPAAIEAAVEEERGLQAAKKLELEIRRIDAHAEWQIEHLNCRADDACERRASKRYEERRREIANAETKAHAAHEKRIAELRAGSRSPSHGRTGAVSSSTSPAAIEPALRDEEQRHRARLLELEQRMIDAHAQWQIDHRNCRANDACDKRASQKYDDQRLEIARQRVKERAAHEKKLAELRAGTLSSPRDALGDVFSSTAGDDRGTAGRSGRRAAG